MTGHGELSLARDLLEQALDWMAADQTRAFDDFIRMPIRNRERLREIVETHVRESLDFDESGPAEPYYRSLGKVLDSLRDAGEDIDRLVLWLKSMAAWQAPGDAAGYPSHYWIKVLDRWARQGYREPHYLDPERMRAFVRTYEEAVSRPRMEFRVLQKSLRKRWMSGREARSEFDELLWESRYENLDMDPSVSVSLAYSVVLERRWWRVNRDMLTEDERCELLAEMVIGVYDSGEGDVALWRYMWPIEKALDLTDIPDFDELKRHW